MCAAFAVFASMEPVQRQLIVKSAVTTTPATLVWEQWAAPLPRQLNNVRMSQAEAQAVSLKDAVLPATSTPQTGILAFTSTALLAIIAFAVKFGQKANATPRAAFKSMSAVMVAGEGGAPAVGESRWTFVMTEDALSKQPNGRAQGEIEGVDLAFIKTGSQIYAMQARCPHLGVPMAGAKVEKGAITCSQHKSRWACATGAVEEWLPGGGVNAMQRLISPPCGLAVYETKIEDGKIYIDVSHPK